MLSRLFGRRNAAPASVRVEPAGLVFPAAARQTVLGAALEAGVPFPHSCRAGGCGTCRCRLVEGEVKELTDKSYILRGDEIADGWILACQSVPRGDVVLEVPNLRADDAVLPVVETSGEIRSLAPLTHDIVELVVATDAPLTWLAGQYADLAVPVVEGPRSYSFATAPALAAAGELRFHVRRVPGGAFTTWLHEAAKVGDRLRLSGPYGDFRLRTATAPIVAVAGGSGLAPIKAMLEQARHDQIARDVDLFVGVRTQADLYGLADLENLARRWLTRMRIVPVLSEEPAGSDWTGRRGLVTEALAELPDLAARQAYMCGPPPMIDAAEAVLVAAGVAPAQIFHDKFLDRSHRAQG
jgi:NAD(P)H-flavin reductase/ferredoxin